jgi:hypothetical protein
MERYNNGVIYKICCKDTNINEIYIGSTCNLSRRKYCHKDRCTNNTNKSHYFVYEFIRNNGGWNNWKLIPIKFYPCDNKNELLMEEQRFIDNLKPKLNKINSFNTESEEKRRNKDYNKIYHQKNKDNINDKCKIRNYQKIKCDCGAIINKGGLSNHKKTKKHNEFILKQCLLPN